MIITFKYSSNSEKTMKIFSNFKKYFNEDLSIAELLEIADQGMIRDLELAKKIDQLLYVLNKIKSSDYEKEVEELVKTWIHNKKEIKKINEFIIAVQERIKHLIQIMKKDIKENKKEETALKQIIERSKNNYKLNSLVLISKKRLQYRQYIISLIPPFIRILESLKKSLDKDKSYSMTNFHNEVIKQHLEEQRDYILELENLEHAANEAANSIKECSQFIRKPDFYKAIEYEIKKYKSPPGISTEEFSEKEIKLAQKKENVLLMDLETNRYCNLKCKYCFVGKMAKKIVPFESLKNIINQGSKCGLRNLNIIGGGEPSIYQDDNKNILDVIKYARKLNLNVEMFTNGLVFGDNKFSKNIFGIDSKSLAKEFLKNKVTLCLKINALDPKIHDNMVGVKGSYNKAIMALTNLIDAGYTKGKAQLVIETVMGKENVNEIPKMWRFVRNNNLIPSFELLRPSGMAKGPQQNLNPDEIKELFDLILDIDRKEYGYDWLPVPPYLSYSCDLNRYICYITVDGDVYNCESFGFKFGNIFQTPLKTILKNPNVKLVRELANNIEGNCKKCRYMGNKCYGGCIGHAVEILKNPLAGDPICWQNKTCSN